MKRIIPFIAFVFCVLSFVKAQNLIPNASFENLSQCANGFGQIYFALPWFQPSTFVSNNTSASSSSDVYDTCTIVMPPDVGIPTNYVGYQNARTGYGYAGIFFHSDTVNWREYIEVPLLSQLVQNKRYCVEFYVSLAEISKEATSTVGAYFSNDSLLDPSFTPQHGAITFVTPQFENPTTNILSSKTNWMLVSGTFIANGGERFMTIGNFHLPANTNAINVSGGTSTDAYYYIDDISVTQCNVGVGELEDISNDLIVFPNPATNELQITSSKFKIKEIKIYNLLGECILHQQLTTSSHPELVEGQQLTIDISDKPTGIYFIEIQTEIGIVRKKIVKE